MFKPIQLPKRVQKFESGQLAKGLPFVRFGKGPQKLVIFPGISDAFLPIASTMPQYISWYYRQYARHFDVCVISRQRGLPTGHTTQDMARDCAAAIEAIGGPVHVLGLSLGSLIAQYLAADFPHLIRGLILSLGSSRGVPKTIGLARHWIFLARHEKWNELYAESVDVTFTGFHRVLWHHAMPVLIRHPGIPNDFIVSMEACINHDARERLRDIQAPALIIGGKKDVLIPESFFRELAELIPSATLRLIENGGHGLYEENKREFDSAVIDFLRSAS
jgi:pimeloyl-ACP methyl ester carboxylesterase